MSQYLLDSNVLSELWKKNPAASVLDWDSETALVWAKLRHSPEVKRQPQSLWDSLIDAMAVRHGIPVATLNGADFRHAVTFNPWTT